MIVDLVCPLTKLGESANVSSWAPRFGFWSTLLLHSNNDMYTWNQVICTKNHSFLACYLIKEMLCWRFSLCKSMVKLPSTMPLSCSDMLSTDCAMRAWTEGAFFFGASPDSSPQIRKKSPLRESMALDTGLVWSRTITTRNGGNNSEFGVEGVAIGKNRGSNWGKTEKTGREAILNSVIYWIFESTVIASYTWRLASPFTRHSGPTPSDPFGSKTAYTILITVAHLATGGRSRHALHVRDMALPQHRWCSGHEATDVRRTAIATRQCGGAWSGGVEVGSPGHAVVRWRSLGAECEEPGLISDKEESIFLLLSYLRQINKEESIE